MKTMFCSACGTTAKPVKKTPGSLLIELFLWCFLIVPGLIYSLWRVSARKPCCPACGNDRMIPVDSPIARSMRERAQVPPPLPR